MQHLYDTSHEFRTFCDQNPMSSGMQTVPQGFHPGFQQTSNVPHSWNPNAELGPRRIPSVVATATRNLSAGQPFVGSQHPMNISGSLPPNSLLFSPLSNPPTRHSPSTSQVVDKQPQRVQPQRVQPQRVLYRGYISNTTKGSQPHPIGVCPFPNCAEPIHNSWNIPEHLKETHIRNGVQISSSSLRPYSKTGHFICEVPECGSSVIMSKCAAHYREHVERYFCPAPNCGYHSGRRDQLQRHAKTEHQDIDVSGVQAAFIKQC
jgi:hypothetical protein